MKKISALILLLSCLYGYAQENLATRSIVDMLEKTQNQITDLVGAFSEEQLNWRPAEGIRSTGETLMHVAASNYYLAMGLGYPTPEGVDIVHMESISGKAALLDAFEKSAAFIREKIGEVDQASLLEEVDLGFPKMNRLSVLMTVLQHNGEHKGQLIAYARSNNIVPPWSAEE